MNLLVLDLTLNVAAAFLCERRCENEELRLISLTNQTAFI